MKYLQFNLQKLRYAVRGCGMSDREFMRQLKRSDCKMTLAQVFGVNFGVKTLIDTCNILGCPLDALFDVSDEEGKRPQINGEINSVNSVFLHSSQTNIKNEVESLRLLLDEKNQRIDDLNRQLDRLLRIIELGQKSDK